MVDPCKRSTIDHAGDKARDAAKHIERTMYIRGFDQVRSGRGASDDKGGSGEYLAIAVGCCCLDLEVSGMPMKRLNMQGQDFVGGI